MRKTEKFKPRQTGSAEAHRSIYFITRLNNYVLQPVAGPEAVCLGWGRIHGVADGSSPAESRGIALLGWD